MWIKLKIATINIDVLGNNDMSVRIFLLTKFSGILSSTCQRGEHRPFDNFDGLFHNLKKISLFCVLYSSGCIWTFLRTLQQNMSGFLDFRFTLWSVYFWRTNALYSIFSTIFVNPSTLISSSSRDLRYQFVTSRLPLFEIWWITVCLGFLYPKASYSSYNSTISNAQYSMILHIIILYW